METKDNLEQTGNTFFNHISALFQKVKPVYVICAVLPLIFIYPKPLMYILKPIIRNWAFYYRKINSVSNKPAEIILTSNPNMNFSSKQIKQLTLIRGTMPKAFKIIREFIDEQEQLRKSQDQSMKHILFAKKHDLLKQKIFASCYIIDMHSTYLQQRQRSRLQHSLSSRETNNQELVTGEANKTDQFIHSQIDFIWVEMILMKLKIIQLQNNCEIIQHVIIKAPERVLQLLQAKILGIKENDVFKIGMTQHSKIHFLKLNKSLETYEQCSATFKIQQKSQND